MAEQTRLPSLENKAKPTLMMKILRAALIVLALAGVALSAASAEAASAPIAQTNIATAITQSSAVLQAIVTPNDASTNYRFDYGTSQYGFGNTTSQLSVGSGFAPVSVSAQVSGLQTATTYYYKVIATNTYGTSEGSILSFTTPGANAPTLVIEPSNATVGIGSQVQLVARYDADGTSGGQSAQDVSGSASWTSFNTVLATHQGSGRFYGSGNGIVTVAATYNSITSYAMIGVGTSSGGGGSAWAQTMSPANVSQNSATFQGAVQPNNYTTTVYFEYGTSMNLGATSGSQTLTGAVSQNVSLSVTNLLANTTYYYRIVAQNSLGTSQGQIVSFVTSSGGGGGYGAPLVTTNSATGVYQNGATLQGTVNPNNNSANAWFEYSTSPSFGQTTASQSVGLGNATVNTSAFVTGLLANTTYYYRAVAGNSYGTSYGSSLTFQTGSGGGSSALAVVTNSPTNVSQNSATFQAYVSGGSGSSYSSANVRFEYGTSPSFGQTTASQSVALGYGQNVSTFVSNLVPNALYYVRAVADGSGYGTTYGATLTFTTQSGGGSGTGASPRVTTGEATSIASRSAVIRGMVDPRGALTVSWFEYGATSAFGRSFGYSSAGSGYGETTILGTLSGLRPGTTYYYRAGAYSAYGNVYGVTRSFRTLGGGTILPPVVPPPAASGEPMTLTFEGAPAEPKAGETFDMTVTYRNPNATARKNVLLTIVLPPNAEFVSATPSNAKVSGMGLTFAPGEVKAGASERLVVRLRVLEGTPAGDAVQSIAVLNWTDPSDAPDSASASLTLRVGGASPAAVTPEAPEGPSLGARIKDAFKNFSLPFWLALGLIILVIVYFTYGFFAARRDAEKVSEF